MLQWCAVMAAALMCMLCCASPAFVSAPDDYFPGDTDGTEMQLMQPVQMEIRLGQEWVGAQSSLFPIVLFGAGILIAGGVLIVMKVLAKRQASGDDEDDEDDD